MSTCRPKSIDDLQRMADVLKAKMAVASRLDGKLTPQRKRKPRGRHCRCKAERRAFGESVRTRCVSCGRIYLGATLAPGRQIGSEQFRQLLRAFADGHSIRASARLADCAKATASNVAEWLGRTDTCGCGKEPGHLGWCVWRYLRSEARQRWVRSRVNRQQFARDDGEALAALIDGIVPRGMDAQVRDEVIQDLTVAVWTGECERDEDSLRAFCKRLTTAVMRAYPTRYGPVSLDAPVGGDPYGQTWGQKLGLT